MNMQRWLLIILSIIVSAGAFADDHSQEIDQFTFSDFDYQIEEQTLGGFERRKLIGGMRVRGWQIGDHTHLGQTKVSDRWGVGFVFEKGNTSYGVNHRGIQFHRRF